MARGGLQVAAALLDGISLEAYVKSARLIMIFRVEGQYRVIGGMIRALAVGQFVPPTMLDGYEHAVVSFKTVG